MLIPFGPERDPEKAGCCNNLRADCSVLAFWACDFLRELEAEAKGVWCAFSKDSPWPVIPRYDGLPRGGCPKFFIPT